jgi:hypothetical protein
MIVSDRFLRQKQNGVSPTCAMEGRSHAICVLDPLLAVLVVICQSIPNGPLPR